MAYMNQEMKKVIATELKKVMPKDWKYSLSVVHHSQIVMTIKSAPFDLIKCDRSHMSINHYYLEDNYDGVALEILKKALTALECAGWYNNTDIMTDYFDVAYYIDIQAGKWDKNFINTSEA